MRLAGDADQVAHGARRREQDRVEDAGLDRLAGLRGRRSGADGAVRRDVLDLPAELDEAGDDVRVEAAAGENWHAFVGWTIDQGLNGLENLSLIPGSVGASPVQNAGAYGMIGAQQMPDKEPMQAAVRDVGTAMASLAGEAAQGTSGVIAAVQNGSGTIGYADESGVPDGMSMALYSQDGSAAYTGPEADAAGAIVEASSRVAGREDNDWALDLDRTAAGYPFVLVSYAIVCQQYSDASVGELVNAYISYIVSDEGQEAAVPQAGNAPLSGTLATGVQAAAASIK